MERALEVELYKLHAEVCKTLSNAKRLQILNLLRQGELSVGELASKLQLREANISQHLSLMRKHGILVSRRHGLNIYYRLAQPKVIQAFDIMREVLLEQLAERAEMITQIQQEGLKLTTSRKIRKRKE